jgi:tetratricopeptide (TPR) repeat protein
MTNAADGSRFALFEEVAEYLRMASAARPLVVALDDMQWADESSWDLLEHVLSHIERDRIMICLTLREEDATPEVAERRTRLSRDERFREIRLARMSRTEQRDWLQQVLHHPADEELVDYLYGQSEGNPFFSVQVLRALVEEHRLRWTGSHWEWTPGADSRLPVAILDLLSRRAARLSPAAKRILASAALIGRAIDTDVAVHAGIATEEQILDAIDEGLSVSVLEVSEMHGESHIAFTHALLVDLMRDSLNPTRRKRLHERIAHAMEEIRPSALAELAHHYDLACDREKAYTYAWRAAEHAAEVYANDDALDLLEAAERHALTLREKAPVRIRRAAVAEAAGRYREAEEIQRSIIDELFGTIELAQRAETKRAIARLRSLQGEAADTTRAACSDLLAEAAALGLDGERIALLMMLSQSFSRAGDVAAAESVARQSLALAERIGDRKLIADSLVRVGTSIIHDRATEATVYLHRAFKLYESADDVVGQIRCQVNLGVASSRVGDFDAAETAYRQALGRGREVHMPDFAGLAALNLGAVFIKRGRLGDARNHLEEAHTLFRKVNNEHHRVAAIYNLAHLAREERRCDDASRLYGATAALAHTIGLAEVAVGAAAGGGLMALEADDIEEALTMHDRVMSEAKALGPGWFQGRELLEAFAIRMALLDNDMPAARERFERAVRLGTEHDAYGTAWLVASCAPLLAEPSEGKVREIAVDYARMVETMGSAPLSAKFSTLLGDDRFGAHDSAAEQTMAG